MQPVSAQGSKSFYVSGYNINIIINKDGSADYEERLTYNFDGEFNGVLRDVDFSGTKGLKNKKVYVIENTKLQELKLNSENSLDEKGDSGTYNFVEDGDLGHFKIFEASQDEEITFVIKYKLVDAVTKYKDIAEFNRKVVDTKWEVALDKINIKITLPSGATKEQLKVFAHGPLTGKSSILDSRNVEFQVPTVSPGNFVETLVLFPIKLVPNSSKIVNKDALPGIMANEGKLASEANETREQERLDGQGINKQQIENQKQEIENQKRKELAQIQMKVDTKPRLIFYAILGALAIMFLYFRYDKEPKHDFSGKYYRELPGEYTPAEMSVLMYFGKVHTRDIMATLMDLVRKKQFSISQDNMIRKDKNSDKKTVQYEFKLIEKRTTVNLKKHEKFLISWLIYKVGRYGCVSLYDIENYVKSDSTALQFKSDYNRWVNLVKEDADEYKFLHKTPIMLRVLVGIVGIYCVIYRTLEASFMFMPISLVLIFEGVILIILAITMNKRSEYGSQQHAMWQAFKKFLKDFSRLDKAEIPSIVLWEHYLVYAISLGVAKEVIKQLPIIFKNEDLNNNQLTYMYGTNYDYFVGFEVMFNNTMHTVNRSVSKAQSSSSSNDSSSFGGGGGFSGGSSGGDGGGGGGGAF
ncbi:DUF2207 domain-containing protein [Clostridium estertheticum]|uniref:DUF2207 domain-containing protein n=1 Tax=Clostridium estertheticum TaxID=238834 RepID=UPI001CF378D8|nr:DUF2207 domain-containing protein [Clostridium estertheticum]MCB2359198.1 DUF2207 domain-containing protein [Clostridium estertheticum]